MCLMLQAPASDVLYNNNDEQYVYGVVLLKAIRDEQSECIFDELLLVAKHFSLAGHIIQ